MPLFDVLRAYLEARASFTEAELAFTRGRFIETTLPAGDFLQRAGDIPRHAAFVATRSRTRGAQTAAACRDAGNAGTAPRTAWPLRWIAAPDPGR